MNCEQLGLHLLCSSLRRNKGRRSNRAPLHVFIKNTHCCQMNGAFNTIQLLPPAVISYLSTRNLGLQTARSPLMSSSWPLLKRREKKARPHSAAPPFLHLINVPRHPMFSSRHRLERGRKPPKLYRPALTYSGLVRSSVTRSEYHPLLLFSLSTFELLPSTLRLLCCSSRWRFTGSSPGSVSRPPWAPSPWGPCIPGPSGGELWMTRLPLHLFSRDVLRGNLDFYNHLLKKCQV